MNTGCQLLSHERCTLVIERHKLSSMHTNMLRVGIVSASATYI